MEHISHYSLVNIIFVLVISSAFIFIVLAVLKFIYEVADMAGKIHVIHSTLLRDAMSELRYLEKSQNAFEVNLSKQLARIQVSITRLEALYEQK